MNWTAIFFSPRGRIGRKGFWVAWLSVIGLAAPLPLLGLPGAPLALMILIPQAFLLAKRMHDLGKSGWFAAIPYALGGAGALAAGLTADEAGIASAPALSGALVALACAIVGVVFFVRIGFAPSIPGPNAYGAPQITMLEHPHARAA